LIKTSYCSCADTMLRVFFRQFCNFAEFRHHTTKFIFANMLYQPSTHISPRTFGPWANMGIAGWSDMWYEKWHIIIYNY
jgi:hypothetical protein